MLVFLSGFCAKDSRKSLLLNSLVFTGIRITVGLYISLQFFYERYYGQVSELMLGSTKITTFGCVPFQSKNNSSSYVNYGKFC